MPPADENTPDFDSMSPEELMAWMETLAERQGADEGFTTDKRVEIAEVDPETAKDTGPGYIPYGMTPEEWAEKQQQEEEEKQARIAARNAGQEQAPMAPPPVEAAPPQPEPAPEPAPAAPAASAPESGGEPDFDSMSPEELMAWMETLAERQGATEGFTTEERVEIAEVDPETAKDTGPGYIPYGMTAEEWAEKQQQEEEEKQARIAARNAGQEQAPPQPEPEPEPPAEQPAASFELPGFETDIETTTEMAPASEEGGLAWLDSLAADQGADLPQMDLSGLGEDVVAPLDLDALSAAVGGDDLESGGDDPMAWLDNLSGGSEEPAFDLGAVTGDDEDEEEIHDAETELYAPEDLPIDSPDVPEPVAEQEDGNDTMLWLESLARDQGADPEEFTTQGDLELTEDAPDVTDDAPGYESYAFEADDLQPVSDVDALDAISDDPDDPVAWLDSLAASGGSVDDEEEQPDMQLDFSVDEGEDDEVPADSGILDALNSAANVSPDEVKGWMDSLLEQGANRTDAPPDYIEEDTPEESAAMEASIPDWLTEQVGPPPDLDAAPDAPAEKPALLEDIVEPDEVDLPNWLQEGFQEGDGDLELEDIFADSEIEEAPQPAASTGISDPKISTGMLAQIDSEDSWVEAFELERKQGKINVEEMPEWYEERLRELGGEDAPAAVSTPVPEIALAEAALPPESSLSMGEPQPVPDWASGAVSVAAPASQIQEVTYQNVEPALIMDDVDAGDDEGLPDWLRQQIEADGESEDSVPDWLKEAGMDDVEAEEIPDWLKESVEEESEVIVPQLDFGPDIDEPEEVASPLTTVPQQAITPSTMPVPQGASPAPVQAVPPDQVAEILEAARGKVQGGDIAAAMSDYEQVVRSNAQLDAVESDLNALMKDNTHKKNATVLRVLGDTLMRRGELQKALDTYRKALNLL